jgi:ABC-type bacteriocin/lantibiotic exporter with double-glycine peptidase domain
LPSLTKGRFPPQTGERRVLLPGVFLGILFMISLLWGCAGPSPKLSPKTARMVEGVPFFPQEEFQCGPASLAGVLNYYGLRMSPAEIAAEIFSRQARGTLDMDMVFYAQRKGMKAEHYAGNFDDLQGNLDSRRPLIVLIDQGFWVYQNHHFMVAVGYDERSIIVNSGKEERKFISRDAFLKTWEKTKFWTLRITPP